MAGISGLAVDGQLIFQLCFSALHHVGFFDFKMKFDFCIISGKAERIDAGSDYLCTAERFDFDRTSDTAGRNGLTPVPAIGKLWLTRVYSLVADRIVTCTVIGNGVMWII